MKSAQPFCGLTFILCQVNPDFHPLAETEDVGSIAPRSTHELPLSLALQAELTGRGARVVEFPTMALRPVSGARAIECQQALDRLHPNDWLVFTSANAVRALQEFRIPLAHAELKVAVVGEQSRLVAEAQGFQIALKAEESDGESLGNELSAQLKIANDNSRILFLRGDKVASGFERAMFAHRERLQSLEIYRAEKATPANEQVVEVQTILREDVKRHPLEVDQFRRVYQIFTSGQSLRYYLELIDDRHPDYHQGIIRYVRELPSCVIGRNTAQVGRELHLNVVVVPAAPSRTAFLEMLEQVVFHERALYPGSVEPTCC